MPNLHRPKTLTHSLNVHVFKIQCIQHTQHAHTTTQHTHAHVHVQSCTWGQWDRRSFFKKKVFKEDWIGWVGGDGGGGGGGCMASSSCMWRAHCKHKLMSRPSALCSSHPWFWMSSWTLHSVFDCPPRWCADCCYCFSATRAKRLKPCWTPSSASSPRTPEVEGERPESRSSTACPPTCWRSCRQTTCPSRWRSACRRWESCSPWTSSCARRLTACRRSSVWCVPCWPTSNWPSTAPSSWARTWGTRWTACLMLAFLNPGLR